MIALIVPVMVNFRGFTRLMHSVDEEVLPVVINNWDANLGVSKAWNAGIIQAIGHEADYALIVNDDLMLFPGTIKKMRDYLADGNIFVTAVNYRDEGRYDSWEGPGVPDFSCWMIRPREFVVKVGWADERFSPAYFEDNDLHYRMKLAGVASPCLPDARMHHDGSVTQNWNGTQVVTPTMFNHNRFYYMQKWGGPPGQETFVHPFNHADNDYRDGTHDYCL